MSEYSGLDPARRPDKENVRGRIAAQKFSGQRDSRIKMPTGPTRRNHNRHRRLAHPRPLCCLISSRPACRSREMFSKIPTPVRLITKEDPP